MNDHETAIDADALFNQMRDTGIFDAVIASHGEAAVRDCFVFIASLDLTSAASGNDPERSVE